MNVAKPLRIWLALTVVLVMIANHCTGQAAATVGNQRQAALALEQQGKNAEAEVAWRAILKVHPTGSEPYAHLGLLEARQEHYKEAVQLYRKALALNPAMPGVRMNLGLALFKDEDFKQTIPVFLALLKSQPASSAEAERLNILLGMAHYGLREYAEAVPYLKRAARGDAQNLPLRLALAHSCLWSKQYLCVMDTYHEILTLNAESAEADMLAGEALDEMKDTPGAIQQFRAAVRANPQEPDVHYGLGYLLWTQMQYPEAASEFQAELENNPDHVDAMLYLGDTQIALKHPEIAQPLLEKVLRVDAKQALAHLDLGIVYADTGRNDDALKELKEAERLDPESVNVRWRLGRLYRSMGKTDEAKAEFGRASSINKSKDTSLVDKISGGHAKDRPVQQPATGPAKM